MIMELYWHAALDEEQLERSNARAKRPCGPQRMIAPETSSRTVRLST